MAEIQAGNRLSVNECLRGGADGKGGVRDTLLREEEPDSLMSFDQVLHCLRNSEYPVFIVLTALLKIMQVSHCTVWQIIFSKENLFCNCNSYPTCSSYDFREMRFVFSPLNLDRLMTVWQK